MTVGLFLTVAGPTRANDAPYKCLIGDISPGIQLSAIKTGSACGGFEVRSATGAIIQSYRGWLGSGFLFEAEKGARVVFVNSYPLAGVGRDGTVRSSDPRDQPLKGVEIFGGGQKLGSFELNMLMGRPGMATAGINNVTWVRKAHLVPGRPPHFLLETTSLRQLTFDLQTGKLVSANDSPEWNRCALIARGAVSNTPKGWHVADLVFAKGTGPKVISLKRVAAMPETGVQTLCLNPVSEGVMTASTIDGLSLNTLQ